jgi:O-methyltransferase involved in polyketide biosynthesis
MTDDKEKIILTEEQETLLVPLYSKAVESQRARPIFVDPKAVEILENVEYDFARLKTPRKTTVTLCIRANKIDAITREFLASHPRSVVIHLGCGLDSRYIRVNNREVEWFDLDMPEVIALRRKFYQEINNYHMIPSSVTRPGWLGLISPGDRAVLVIAEGLLMYLEEEDVKALVRRLKESFPGCELAFDVFSLMTAKSVKAHPALKQTGAVVRWGIDDARGIERWAEGIRLKEEWYFTQAPEIKKLGVGYRLSFKVAGLFTAAKTAHRILYYAL